MFLPQSGRVLMLVTLSWVWPVVSVQAAPIEKNFLFFVEIQSTFSPSYEILSPGGINKPIEGQITLNSRQCLHTLKPIPVALWQVSPDGSTRSPVPAFRMKWTAVSAEYSGDGTSETIPADLLKVTVDHQDTPVGSSFELSSGLLGYNQVAVHSDEPLPGSSQGNSRLIVRLAGVFESLIE